MSRLDDLRAAGIVACRACDRPFAEVVPLKVGQLFNTPQIERVPLCRGCALGVWVNWPVRK